MATPGVGDDPAAVKEERDDDILSQVDSDGSDEGSLSDGTAFTQSPHDGQEEDLETKEKTQGEA